MTARTRSARVGIIAIAISAGCVAGVEPAGPGAIGDGGDTTTTTADGGNTSMGGGGTSSASGGMAPTGSGGSTGGSTGNGGSSSGGSGPTGTLRVQYRDGGSSPTDNQIHPQLNIINDGTTTVQLSTVTLRYWFTKDAGAPAMTFWCDYAMISCSNLAPGSFSTTSGTDADHYLEISFTGGMLGPGDQTGEIQGRFHTDDYAALDESNDYSYDGTKTSFTDHTEVTAYDGGQLVWGTEP